MLDLISPTNVVVGGILLFGCWLLYRAALPKPLPGIPYLPESARRLLGDLPAMLAHEKETGYLTEYLHLHCVKQNQPVMQFWVRPFERPWVVVCDGRESQDAMARRVKEFDRSPVFSDLFRAYVPHSQIAYPTNTDWKYNRRLVSEAMLPTFLDGIASKRAYDATIDLVELWKEKTRLAENCTYDVYDDVHEATADAIWSVTFGSDIQTTKEQTEYLSGLNKISLPGDTVKEIMKVPRCSSPPAYGALKALMNSSQIALQFGYRLHWLAVKLLPSLRRAKAVRDALVRERLQTAQKTFSKGNALAETKKVKCALDLVVQREFATAAKENRQAMGPEVTKHVHDELCLFLFAGASTTADTISWGLKELSVNAGIQSKIREYMEKTFASDFSASTQPASEAIAKPNNPYLEAFMQEVLRFHSIANANLRIARQNTRILGYDIPAGTDVVFVISGPSFTSPAMPIDETTRSATSQASSKESIQKWDQPGLEKFLPERWLVEKSNGDVEFDPTSNPMQSFGEGPRSCFGQKFAYLEMRIMFSLILWNFELLPIDSSLMDFKVKEELTKNPRNVRVKLRRTA